MEAARPDEKLGWMMEGNYVYNRLLFIVLSFVCLLLYFGKREILFPTVGQNYQRKIGIRISIGTGIGIGIEIGK